MGVHQNISGSNYPRQGDFLNKRTKVCFNYDTKNYIGGTVIRDDREDPFLTLIKLDDGRYISSTECQYSIPK
ncbi:hypothetical protein [Ornithinibacillus sp. JPR2-1]|uniref:hypothetical protein n=1 Tax=Ornithinibacillus sp. JPR2-1 TaxID=2094019 RepID=UPI0031D0890E